MRYFRIYADEHNPQPRFLNWYKLVKPGRRKHRQIYEELEKRSYLKVELNREIPFMDIISYPCFMVSKEFGNLIRLYCPGISFKYTVLVDEANQRTASYLIPDLAEVACLHEESELSRDRSEIIKGILEEGKMEMQPVFTLGGVEGRYIMGNLEFVESVYRREVMGMKIEEFRVQ